MLKRFALTIVSMVVAFDVLVTLMFLGIITSDFSYIGIEFLMTCFIVLFLVAYGIVRLIRWIFIGR